MWFHQSFTFTLTKMGASSAPSPAPLPLPYDVIICYITHRQNCIHNSPAWHRPLIYNFLSHYRLKICDCIYIYIYALPLSSYVTYSSILYISHVTHPNRWHKKHTRVNIPAEQANIYIINYAMELWGLVYIYRPIIVTFYLWLRKRKEEKCISASNRIF